MSMLKPLTLALFLALPPLAPVVAAAQSGAPAASTSTTTASPSTFHKTFSGKIAGKYPFTMDLKSNGGVLTGKYRYVGKQLDLMLQGKIDPSGTFTLEERNLSAVKTGTFSGALAGKTISGVWQSADGAKSLPFLAEQSSEIVIGNKKALLTKAVGSFGLEQIEGSGGANGMWETWKQAGRWQSSTSGISAGRRQATKIALTPADIRLLDSMAVKVDADLSTRLVADGKTVLALPYREQGMQFDIKNAPGAVLEDGQNKLGPGTTVLDGTLYLLARDGVDFTGTLSGSFDAKVDDTVIVSYAIKADAFEVRFLAGECCESTIFRFTRSRKP